MVFFFLIFSVFYLYFLMVLLVYYYYSILSSFFGGFFNQIYINSGVLGLSGWIFYMLFLLVMLSCFFGFFSYSDVIFSVFEFTFVFALCSWFMTFIYFVSYMNFCIYLSKSGDSFYLTFLLMLIEIVSEFSRPLSLSIRLFVNITVGHILCLVGFDFYEFICGLFVYSLFLILMESVVFLIQSYIFSRLVYMYMGN